MSNPTQIQEDLSFVRRAIVRRSAHRSPAAIMWCVAVYVLVGYSLIDLAPRWAGWFFSIGGVAMWGVMTLITRRQVRREGQVNHKTRRRLALHWCGGIVLAVVGAFALAVVLPPLRGPGAAQVLVVMIGLVYFLGGVHFDHQFLWLGPVLMIGGVLVGLVPHYGWTALGSVIALGLVVPTFFKRRPDNDGQDSGLDSGAAHPLPV